MIWRYVLHYPFRLMKTPCAKPRPGLLARTILLRLRFDGHPKRTTKRGATEREIYSTELVRTADNESWSSRSVGARSFDIWCVKWWARCSMLAAGNLRLRTSIACTNCETGSKSGPTVPPHASSWLKSSSKKHGTSERAALFGRLTGGCTRAQFLPRPCKQILLAARLANVFS